MDKGSACARNTLARGIVTQRAETHDPACGIQGLGRAARRRDRARPFRRKGRALIINARGNGPHFGMDARRRTEFEQHADYDVHGSKQATSSGHPESEGQGVSRKEWEQAEIRTATSSLARSQDRNVSSCARENW